MWLADFFYLSLNKECKVRKILPQARVVKWFLGFFYACTVVESWLNSQRRRVRVPLFSYLYVTSIHVSMVVPKTEFFRVTVPSIKLVLLIRHHWSIIIGFSFCITLYYCKKINKLRINYHYYDKKIMSVKTSLGYGYGDYLPSKSNCPGFYHFYVHMTVHLALGMPFHRKFCRIIQQILSCISSRTCLSDFWPNKKQRTYLLKICTGLQMLICCGDIYY